MTFTESNTTESLLRDILCGGVTHHTAAGPCLSRRASPAFPCYPDIQPLVEPCPC